MVTRVTSQLGTTNPWDQSHRMPTQKPMPCLSRKVQQLKMTRWKMTSVDRDLNSARLKEMLSHKVILLVTFTSLINKLVYLKEAVSPKVVCQEEALNRESFPKLMMMAHASHHQNAKLPRKSDGRPRINLKRSSTSRWMMNQISPVSARQRFRRFKSILLTYHHILSLLRFKKLKCS